MNLQGQVAIVTGAASGLGRATARRSGARGDRSPCSISTPRRSSPRQRRSAAMPSPWTSPTPQRVEAACREIEALGPVRVLVNCAGVAPAARMVGRDGPMPLAQLRAGDPGQPDRHLQHDAARRRGHGAPGAAGRRRARRDRQHRLGRGVRGADRPDRLRRLQRRRRRPDAACRARTREPGHPRDGDRTGPVRHTDAARPAGEGAGEPGRHASPFPPASGPARGIRRPGPAHHRAIRCSTAP